MAYQINRINGQNYAENLVNFALSFNDGTWTVASGTGTASLNLDNKVEGVSSLLIQNNTPASSITVTNSNQNTVIDADGDYQLSWYLKKNIALEVREVNVLIYEDAVLLDTQTCTLGSTDADEDVNNIWQRFQSDQTYTFTKGSVITFQFQIASATTAQLTTFVYVDALMLNLAGRGNSIVPIYDKPLGLKTQSFGIYDYNDSTTSGTPINLVADTWTLLTNDGAGTFTNKTYALNGISDVFDTSTNLFDFTDLELGDSVDIRIDLEGTTTTANQDFDIDLILAYGTAEEYRIPFITEQSYKAADAHPLICFNSIYIGNSETLNNSARFEIRSNDTATVVVNGWYCRVNKRLV